MKNILLTQMNEIERQKIYVCYEDIILEIFNFVIIWPHAHQIQTEAVLDFLWT